MIIAEARKAVNNQKITFMPLQIITVLVGVMLQYEGLPTNYPEHHGLPKGVTKHRTGRTGPRNGYILSTETRLFSSHF